VVQILQIFRKSCKEYASAGRIYRPIPHFDQISVKISVLEVHSSVPNFTAIGATCHPCGAKNLKISLWV